jgi:hypothetical protein
MVRILFILLLLSSATAHCQRQGICGTVLLVEGNQMPGSKKNAPKPVIRQILAYKPVHRDSAKFKDGLYTAVTGELVQSAESAADGTFRLKLPPGDYPIFIKEKEGLFANLYDSDGFISVVKVRKRKFTKVEISINYRAFY